MNNPITVRTKSDIGITDEQKNELREKLVYAFIEQLRKSGMYKVTEGKNGNVWILRADLILPKKYKAEPVNGWISVTDEMPRLGQRVMAFCRAGIMTFLRYDGEVWFEMSSRNEYLLSFVTHWQPLPEPPKEEDYDLLLRPNEEWQLSKDSLLCIRWTLRMYDSGRIFYARS